VIVNEFRVMRARERGSLREGPRVRIHRPVRLSLARARERSFEELADYRTGEKAAGISSLFSCRIGRTPACGGHSVGLRPPFVASMSFISAPVSRRQSQANPSLKPKFPASRENTGNFVRLGLRRNAEPKYNNLQSNSLRIGTGNLIRPCRELIRAIREFFRLIRESPAGRASGRPGLDDSAARRLRRFCRHRRARLALPPRGVIVPERLASAFVARWCAGYKVETSDGVFRVRDDEPAARTAASMHRTP